MRANHAAAVAGLGGLSIAGPGVEGLPIPPSRAPTTCPTCTCLPLLYSTCLAMRVAMNVNIIFCFTSTTSSHRRKMAHPSLRAQLITYFALSWHFSSSAPWMRSYSTSWTRDLSTERGSTEATRSRRNMPVLSVRSLKDSILRLLPALPTALLAHASTSSSVMALGAAPGEAMRALAGIDATAAPAGLSTALAPAPPAPEMVREMKLRMWKRMSCQMTARMYLRFPSARSLPWMPTRERPKPSVGDLPSSTV
mmetsp:Transcript_5287/g.15486  ORF Transcript_5287/g.15486 Transcript_5287/m.15486 type:complete len:252 (+) Transcript_5287:76-831(+)